MKRVALILLLIAFNASGWDLKSTRPVPEAFDAIVNRYDITIIGEYHGHPEHIKNYRSLIHPMIRRSVDTIFLEWVYDHNQPRLNEYLSDVEADAGTVREAYYICTLARNRLFDQGPGKPMLTFEQFQRQVAPLAHPELLLQTCDNGDNMRHMLRQIRRVKRSFNYGLKVCAVDYWDYDDDKDQTYARQRLATVPYNLKQLLTRKFHVTRHSAVKNAREIMMSKNVIDCVNGRKKSIGIVGGGHTHEKNLTGVVRQFFARKEKVASILQLAAFTDPNGSENRCAGCFETNMDLQKKLMEIKTPIVAPSRSLSREDRQTIGFDHDSNFPLTNNYLVFQAPVAQPRSPHAVLEFEQKLLGMRGSY